jgi:hypothetical protein
MSKLMLPIAAAALASVRPSRLPRPRLGPDAAVVPGRIEPARRAGQRQRLQVAQRRVRVQIYNSSNFLVKGQRVAAIDLPVTAGFDADLRRSSGAQHLRDRGSPRFDGDNKSGDWSDGGGFSAQSEAQPAQAQAEFRPSCVAGR